MVVIVSYVFIGLWAFFTLALVFFQMMRPVDINRKWNWANPHEKCMVGSAGSWIMIFISKGWQIPVAL